MSSQLSKEFQEHIDHFPKGLSSSKSVKRQDIDNEGLTLWNLCIRLLRTNEAQITKPSDVLLAARVFAFHLLDAANAKAAPTGAHVVRLMKIALKAGKSCLGMHCVHPYCEPHQLIPVCRIKPLRLCLQSLRESGRLQGAAPEDCPRQEYRGRGGTEILTTTGGVLCAPHMLGKHHSPQRIIRLTCSVGMETKPARRRRTYVQSC